MTIQTGDFNQPGPISSQVNCPFLSFFLSFFQRALFFPLDDQGFRLNLKASLYVVCLGMNWLLLDHKAGDSLFFEFSGHGKFLNSFSMDEDESPFPVQFLILSEFFFLVHFSNFLLQRQLCSYPSRITNNNLHNTKNNTFNCFF